jgi:hypothetical protein
MAKNDPEAPTKSSLSDFHMVGKMSMGLDLEVLGKSLSN